MNIRYEFCGNPEYVEIHTSIKLIDERYVSVGVEPKNENSRQLMAVMSGTEGVTSISLKPYSVTATRGMAFSRKQVLDNLKEQLLIWLQVNNLIPSDEPVVQLPDIRQDVTVKKCPECQALQDREMKKLYSFPPLWDEE